MGESLGGENASSSLDRRRETDGSRFESLWRELLDGVDRMPVLVSGGGRWRDGGGLAMGESADSRGEGDERVGGE